MVYEDKKKPRARGPQRRAGALQAPIIAMGRKTDMQRLLLAQKKVRPEAQTSGR
jgi:hypothetical protein